MKLKVLFIFTFILTITIILTALQSCEDLFSYNASICDIELTGLNYKYPDVQPDTMTTTVGLRVTAYPNQSCYILPSFNLISTCYATKKCANWQNEIMQSSFKLSFDKQVIISGDTILPNTDIFQKSNFTSGIEVKKDDWDCNYIGYTITFGSDLLNQMTFEQGIYNATFTCNTNDNRTFVKQRQIIFKL